MADQLKIRNAEMVDIPGWWPTEVREWAKRSFSEANPPECRRDELERLITDQRMKAVIERLIPPSSKIEKPETTKYPHKNKTNNSSDYEDDGWDYQDALQTPLQSFIEYAWFVRAIWRTANNSFAYDEEKNLRQLKLACDNLLALLRINELAPSLALGTDFRVGQNRLHDLNSMLRQISDFSAKGPKALHRGYETHELEALLNPIHPKSFQKKLSGKTAEQVFVIRFLSSKAKKLFNRLNYDAVATTAEILFDGKTEITADRVKDLWKTRKG